MMVELIASALVGASVVFAVWLKRKGQKEQPVKPIEPSRPKPHHLTLSVSQDIYRDYIGLDEEFQQFPDLFGMLSALEAQAKLENNIDGSTLRHGVRCKEYAKAHPRRYGRGYHDYDSDHLPEYKDDCKTCRPFKELKSAVAELRYSQHNRNRAIEEAKRKEQLADVQSTLLSYEGMAERIRAEAKIHREVTTKVFKELS